MPAAPPAHDHQIGRKLFLGAFGLTLGGRGHQGVHTAAGLLHAVGHSVKNGVGGKGSAGHAIDGQRLRLHDLAGQLIDGGGADAGGLGVLGHHDGLDGALGKSHLNGDVAVHAGGRSRVSAGRVGAAFAAFAFGRGGGVHAGGGSALLLFGGRAAGHERQAQHGGQHQAEQFGSSFLHGSTNLL